MTIELLAAKGYAGTTVTEVAEMADVTTGTVYYYFPSKLQLVEAAYEQNVETLAARVRDRLKNVATLKGQIAALLDEAIALNREAPYSARMSVHMMTEATHYPELKGIVRWNGPPERILSDMARAAIERGELGLDAEPDAIAHMLVAAMRGLAAYSIYADPVDHEEAVRIFRLVLERGLTSDT